MDRLEFQQLHEKLLSSSPNFVLGYLEATLYKIHKEAQIMGCALECLSTLITSATSNSGTETEDSPSPIGKPGERPRKSTPAEPTGKGAKNMDASLGNE